MALHFVRFADNYGRQYQNAVRVFGRPHFMHRLWDQRARREIAEGDVIVFAKGDEQQPVSPYNGDDEYYSKAIPTPNIKIPTPSSQSKNTLRISHRASQRPANSIIPPIGRRILDMSMTQSKIVEVAAPIFARWGCEAMPVETADQLAKLLSISLGLGCLFNEDVNAEREWMQTPHSTLKTRPITMVIAGKADEVLQVVNQERNL